jgi:predicted TIM-barrel fold metal-dependent hydrolase
MNKNLSMNPSPHTRRSFLGHAGALLGSIPLAETFADDTVPVIDTHVHFYDPTRPAGVPWPPKDSPLYRTTLPADYLKAAGGTRPDQVIIVEASEWVEDNQWLIDLAEGDPLIAGIVGRLSPGDLEFRKQLERFASQPIYRGIRAARNILTERGEETVVREDLKALAAAGLSLDVNGGAEALQAASLIATAIPELRIVVNHLGSPGSLEKGIDEAWRAGLAKVAEHPQVWCKFSAIVELARGDYGAAPLELDRYRPFLDIVWETFGAERLLYGSNWPVCERGAGLPEVRALAEEYLREKGDQALHQVMGGNSRLAYALR